MQVSIIYFFDPESNCLSELIELHIPATSVRILILSLSEKYIHY